jgi:hypothetical protein
LRQVGLAITQYVIRYFALNEGTIATHEGTERTPVLILRRQAARLREQV